MDQLRRRLPFCSIFYSCKSMKILYLFISQQSVILKQAVMVTQKTRHSSLRLSAYLCVLCVEYTVNAENAEIRRKLYKLDSDQSRGV